MTNVKFYSIPLENVRCTVVPAIPYAHGADISLGADITDLVMYPWGVLVTSRAGEFLIPNAQVLRARPVQNIKWGLGEIYEQSPDKLRAIAAKR